MAVFTIAALAAEIANDPAALGYAPLLAAGRDNAVTALLNTLTATNVWRGRIDGAELTAVVDPTEFLALTVAKQNLCNGLTGASGGVDTSSPSVRAAFSSIFAAGATRTALAALAQRPGTRAEVLWGVGTVITDDQVARALGKGV